MPLHKSNLPAHSVVQFRSVLGGSSEPVGDRYSIFIVSDEGYCLRPQRGVEAGVDIEVLQITWVRYQETRKK
jgi:hypothetical protein